MKAVSIIVPVFNQWTFTKKCLISLKKTTPLQLIEVIVVDNASFDETHLKCPVLGNTLFGDNFFYLRNEKNINFGPACNQGAQAGSADYLFFLNNDTITTDNWLPPLIAALQKDELLGAVGPLLLYPENNQVQHLGISFTPTNNMTHLYHGIPSKSDLAHKSRQVQALTGAALMLKRQLFIECGGFYEKYKNGYEDMDFCVQLAQKGYKLKVEPSSIIYHYTSQSQGRFEHDQNNSLIFMQRTAEYVKADTHIQAAKDGLDIDFNELLQLYYRLLPEETRKLDLWAKQADLSQLLEMLLKYPFWENGYELALKMAKQDKQLSFDILQTQSLYFPTKKVYARLARVSGLLGLQQEVDSCRQELKEMNTYPSTFDYCQRLKSIKNWADKLQDSVLMNIYQRLRH